MSAVCETFEANNISDKVILSAVALSNKKGKAMFQIHSSEDASGDGFCDTEADPHPIGEVQGAPCDFQSGPKDANNDYYTPPLDNYMTYFKPCRCRFTQEQYNFMALTFLLGGTQLH